MRKHGLPSLMALDNVQAVCYSISNPARPDCAENPVANSPARRDFQDSPKSESERMPFDAVNLHWLWKETKNKLECYAQRVREGKDVMAASEFARWVRMSGILTLLKAFPQSPPLLVDADSLAKQVEDLIYDCGEMFRNKNADARYTASDIAEINRKLDVLAAGISRFVAPGPVVETPDAGSVLLPALRVIEGGGGV